MEENNAAVPGTWNPGTNYADYADTRYQLPQIDNGELLFSFPLPIICLKKPTSQININYIQGMWHRQPPTVMKNLEGPRPPRGKSRKKARKFHC